MCIIEHGCKQQQEDPHRFSPGIENQREKRESQVSEQDILRDVMSKNAQWKKGIQKRQTRKNHRSNC
jgi:hypothetical protein